MSDGIVEDIELRFTGSYKFLGNNSSMFMCEYSVSRGITHETESQKATSNT
jgi:hypothetical protein